MEGAPPPLIVPERGIGPVVEGLGRAELRALLGAEAIDDDAIPIGEGVCSPGSRVYPGTPDQLVVLWTDSTLATIAEVETSRAGSRWRTGSGVRVGSTLRELEDLAGGPIEFYGFGWDYGGTALWDDEGGRLRLRLAADPASQREAERDPRYGDIVGERLIRSDHPLIREMTIRVRSIAVPLAEARTQVPCPSPDDEAREGAGR